MAGVGLFARIPCVRGGTAGVADARLVWLANVVSDGTAEPLPYVPLINPLELGLLFALFGVYVWSRSAVEQLSVRKGYFDHATQLIAGTSLFVFFTALVMRTAHHWGGVPFELEALLESMLVQAGLSIAGP